MAACELVAFLAFEAPAASPALASSALEQLLRSSPLPLPPGQPLVDTAPCARALLTYALNDVAIAQATASAKPPEQCGHGLAALLCAARLYRPLESYLRLLSSPSPLHTFFGAVAALRARRYNAASERFRHAFRVASTSPQQLVALLDAPRCLRFSRRPARARASAEAARVAQVPVPLVCLARVPPLRPAR